MLNFLKHLKIEEDRLRSCKLAEQNIKSKKSWHNLKKKKTFNDASATLKLGSEFKC